MTGKDLLLKARANRVRALEYVGNLPRANGSNRYTNVVVFMRSKSPYMNEEVLFRTYDELKRAA